MNALSSSFLRSSRESGETVAMAAAASSPVTWRGGGHMCGRRGFPHTERSERAFTSFLTSHGGFCGSFSAVDHEVSEGRDTDTRKDVESDIAPALPSIPLFPPRPTASSTAASDQRSAAWW